MFRGYIGNFWINIGWFKGEPIALLEIAILDFFPRIGSINIFMFKVLKFVFAFGYSQEG